MKKQFKNITFTVFIIICAAIFSSPIFATSPKKTLKGIPIEFVGEQVTALTLEKLPRKAEKFIDKEYRFFNGEFFQPEGEIYRKIQAPLSVVVASIPNDYQRIIMGGQIFYYSKGIFYKQNSKKTFKTVRGPAGGQVAKLPQGCQKVKINKRNYFLFYDVVFKQSESRSRKYFEVVGYVDK